MRHIAKREEPRALREYRARNPRADWHGDVPGDVKKAVREQLGVDQLGLCCYCGVRVTTDLDSVHVEHFLSHTAHEAERLSWRNLFLSCNSDDHCGRFKAAHEVTRLDPGNQPERWLRYLRSGTLEGGDVDATNDLQLLGLNHPLLRLSRQRAVSAVQQVLARKHPGGWTRPMLVRELARAIEARLPFLPAIELWLTREIERR